MTESHEPTPPQNSNYDSSKITVLRGLEAVQKEKEAAITAQQYELAAELRDREVKLR